MNPIEALQAKLAQIAGDMSALTAAVQAENRAMTAEENEKFNKSDAEYKLLETSIKNMERAEEIKAQMAQPQPRVTDSNSTATMTQPAVPGHTIATGGTPAAHNFANHGFTKGFGEFLMAVRSNFAFNKHDQRLMVNAITTWAGETVGADGGFGLPPAFMPGIMSLVTAPDSFVRALNPYPTQSDIITVPKDEDAPWSTTAVTAAKTAEGGAITTSKPSIGQLKVPMYGVKSLVHVDEKSLRDMTFLAAYVERKMGEKIRWKIENYVVNGTGENEPLGVLNAPGLKAISAADGTSTATALSAYDVGLMEASALQGAGGFWIAHPLIKAQLRTLSIGNIPVFQSDWKAGQTVDTLLGYPYYSSPACKACGTQGDIVFVKPDGYLLAFEQGGIQSATTIAFAFDQNLQSFRATLYMGGSPTLSAVVTLPDGSTTQSNLVALAGSRS